MINDETRLLQDELISKLRQNVDMTDPRVEMAFQAIPRHIFLPNLPLDKVYTDDAVPVKRDAHGTVVSSSSQPSMMVLMLNQLQLRPGDNVLEIGAGTGYNAAIMQCLVGDSGNVTSIELDKVLARQAQDNLQHAGIIASKVNIVHGDGARGYSPRAAYDRIISTVGLWDIPAAWVQQLKPNGILVAPIWLDGLQVSAAFRCKPDGTLYSENNIPCGFVEMRGNTAGPAMQKRIGSSALTLMAANLNQIDAASLHMLLSEDQGEAYIGFPLTAKDYWSGLLPYLMLHEPENQVFALYTFGDENEKKAYSLEGAGFAFIAQGSAAFVPFTGDGKVHTFAGSDAYMSLYDCVAAWDAAGRPNADALRLRLVPVAHGTPSVQDGKLYPRRDHNLHVWLSQ